MTEGAEALLRELVEVQQEADGFVEAEVTGFEDESDAAWSQSEAEVRRKYGDQAITKNVKALQNAGTVAQCIQACLQHVELLQLLQWPQFLQIPSIALVPGAGIRAAVGWQSL